MAKLSLSGWLGSKCCRVRYKGVHFMVVISGLGNQLVPRQLISRHFHLSSDSRLIEAAK